MQCVEVMVLLCLVQDRSGDRPVRRPRTLPSLEGGSSNGSARCELKLYVGGSETTPATTREKNVMRARCMASRMLGELGITLSIKGPFFYCSHLFSFQTLLYHHLFNTVL